MRFAVEEENEHRFFLSSHACTKAVIMLYYNCQLCFVSAASHHSPSLIKFGGKYRQGRGVWAEELTTFKRPCGWIIAAMKRPWLRPDVAPSRRVGGGEIQKGFQEPTQRVKSCCTCIQTAIHTLGLLRIFISLKAGVDLKMQIKKCTWTWGWTHVEPGRFYSCSKTRAVLLLMQVFSYVIEREVIKERRQVSVFCSWLTLELPSAAIGSPLGCAEWLLNSYGDSLTWPYTAVHAHATPVVPMSKRQHPASRKVL